MGIFLLNSVRHIFMGICVAQGGCARTRFPLPTAILTDSIAVHTLNSPYWERADYSIVRLPCQMRRIEIIQPQNRATLANARICDLRPATCDSICHTALLH